jgi:hypothetical protein
MSRRWLLLAVSVLVLNASLWLASGIAAGPLAGIGDYFFGPKLVRAEVVMFDGSLQDWRIDRGRIRSTAGRALMLKERDGTVVTIPVAPDARIDLNGRPIVFERLRNGMQATTIRLGDEPASTVKATVR